MAEEVTGFVSLADIDWTCGDEAADTIYLRWNGDWWEQVIDEAKGHSDVVEWRRGTTARAEAEGLREEVERLRAERDFLLARSGHAGKATFGGARWTGVSSNAVVTVAFGGEANDLPYDNGDLAACYRTMLRLPRHLHSDKVWALLEEGERYVARHYNIAEARRAAAWPENARAALTEPRHD